MRNTVSWSRRRAARALALVLALAVVVGTGSAASGPRSAPRPGAHPGHPRRARPGAGQRARRGRRLPRAGGGEARSPNGTVIGPDRTAYTLPAEASGRSAVRLAPGQYVEFTLPRAANALTVRYSIPDSATGGGITAPLDVTVNGTGKRTMTLTSQYSWLYNQYPFSNDPNAGLLHPDWWITECGCVPASTTPTPTITTPFRPMHFYDEQRLLLGEDLQGRRHGPPHGPRRHERRVDRHRPARLRARRRAARPAQGRQRAAVRRRPDRHEGLRERLRQGHRVRPEEGPAGLRAAGTSTR